MKNTPLKLGTSTNLIKGYNPLWMTETKGNNALFEVQNPAVKETPVSLPERRGEWSFPYISLHDCATSLLDELLPYRIKNPADSLETAVIPSGALLINDRDRQAAIKTLSGTLGVDLGKDKCGYVLVQLKRVDDEIFHSSGRDEFFTYPLPTSVSGEDGITDEYKGSMTGLKRIKSGEEPFSPEMVTEKEANDYLNLFYKSGTHFVSGVTLGDTIFQIFQVAEAPFKEIKKTYKDSPEKLSGKEAVLFAQFTTDYNTGSFGYVQQYGKIMNLSRSESLAQSVREGEWYENVFAQGDSIFAPFRLNSAISLIDLNTKFLDVTAAKTYLTSLTLFMEYSRRLPWERVFKGALIQKYRTAVKPGFHVYYDSRFRENLKKNNPAGMLSTISTPTINLYNPFFDLAELKLTVPEIVKTFTLTTNILTDSLKNETFLPGKDVFIHVQVAVLENKETSMIKLTDEGMKNVTLYARHFFGALIVSNASETSHFSIIDGLKYLSGETDEDGRELVKVQGSVIFSGEDIPATDIPRYKDNLEYVYAFAESVYGMLDTTENNSLLSFVRDCFSWIVQCIPADTKDINLLELRIRALDLTHIDKDTSIGIFVPVLPESAYEKEIDSMLDYVDEINKNMDVYQRQIENRKLQELIIDVAKDLNKNIVDTGKLLHDYLKSCAEEQQALSDWYENIINGKKKEQLAQQLAIDELDKELKLAKADLIADVQDYEEALRNKQLEISIKEGVNFGLTVARDLFSLGTSIFIPASSIGAVKELGSLAQQIQKFLNIVSSLDKFYKDITQSIDTLKDAQKEFEGISGLLSSDMKWDELGIRFDEILSYVPAKLNVGKEKTKLVASFKVFILKGKAYTSGKSTYNATSREIYIQQSKQRLIKEQIERLNQLGKDLNPSDIKDLEIEKIDLTGLIGSLSSMQSHMLSMLSRSFILRDQSLSYIYLQPSTPVTSFSTLGIKSALVDQIQNTNKARAELEKHQAFTTNPQEVYIEIPSGSLKEGGIYQFNLHPDFCDFQPYVDVKVKAVVAKVEGIQSTDTGEYVVKLRYRGRPFYNKGLDGRILTFNTLERGRAYIYKVEGNRPQFSDHGESWSENATMITPFSCWEISLPTVTNKNLLFDGLTVKVTLTFILQTRILEEKIRINSGEYGFLPSEQELVSAMGSGGTKLNGWDAVLNMQLNNINEVLKKQYEELKKEHLYGGKITVDTRIEKEKIKNITRYDSTYFNLEYGYPQLEFLVNADKNTRLIMQITAGEIKSGSRYAGVKTEENRIQLEKIADLYDIPKESIHEETIEGKVLLVMEYFSQVTEVKNGQLEAIIQLSTVKGLVKQNQQICSIVLDMEKGTFEAKNIKLDMSDPEKLAFSEAVKSYFSNNPVYYIINSLDLSKISTLADLKPNQFLFKVLTTRNNNHLLQVFIHTNNRQITDPDYSHLSLSTDIEEPVSEGSQTSIMISNELFFASILPASVCENKWMPKGKDPQDKKKFWYTILSGASIEESIDLSAMNRSYRYGDCYVFEKYEAKINPYRWDLDDMTLNPEKTGTIKLTYSGNNKFITICHKTIYNNMGGKTTSKDELNSTLLLTISGNLPLTISGLGREQDIIINLKDQLPTIVVKTSGGGSCGCDDIQKHINNKLGELLMPALKKNLSMDFKSISVFVLKNLLFPFDNYINLQQVYVPGDVLILGKFEK
ncbi:MAG: hypothetical protein LUG18_09275 [Candidatus Azobacteroides sp.]|nr:hypothetical protein [Candidatus Azobacteroides sp.]